MKFSNKSATGKKLPIGFVLQNERRQVHEIAGTDIRQDYGDTIKRGMENYESNLIYTA